MLRFFCLVVCFIAVGASPVKNDKDGSRIMNGKIASQGQFPFAVSLQQYYPGADHQHICSISLITTKTCLGAAHCVYDEGMVVGAANLCGIVGSVSQGTEFECHELASVHPHEEYDNEATINDICLFIFQNPVQLGGDVQIIKLAGPSIPIADEKVTVLGWGVMELGGDSPHRLRYTYMHVSDPSVCDDQFGGQLRDDQVCIAGENTGSCGGDSGGPIVLTDSNRQIAVVSYGKTECDTLPFVTTDIRKFTEWIKEHAEGEPVIEG